ncbi:MAG: hypothetical protein LBI10_03710 [Deltaproteobacteria bacterium]|jgi:hypothetical protein|nr:hypothetical protein [Deltaproteobacteria bacterium]
MIFKKTGLFVLTLAMTLSLAYGLSAQPQDLDNITAEQLNKEGPLTQKDVELYIKFFELSATTVKNESQKPKGQDLDDTFSNTASNFAKENNISIVRLRYIMEKIPMAIMGSATDTPIPADMPYLALSPEESALVKENTPKIVAVIQKFSE